MEGLWDKTTTLSSSTTTLTPTKQKQQQQQQQQQPTNIFQLLLTQFRPNFKFDFNFNGRLLG